LRAAVLEGGFTTADVCTLTCANTGVGCRSALIRQTSAFARRVARRLDNPKPSLTYSYGVTLISGGGAGATERRCVAA
jgi:hypothetical protein